VNFRKDGKKIGEKMGRERNLLTCLVGWICGKKTSGSGYFLPRPTKMVSPQIGEKTEEENQ